MKFSEMLGENPNLPDGFIQERDRELCLEVFDEYEKMDKTIY